jgi:hypothetical protein
LEKEGEIKQCGVSYNRIIWFYFGSSTFIDRVSILSMAVLGGVWVCSRHADRSSTNFFMTFTKGMKPTKGFTGKKHSQFVRDVISEANRRHHREKPKPRDAKGRILRSSSSPSEAREE